MENTSKESKPRDSEVLYWPELHTCHLQRNIDPLMLDECGKTEFIKCILRHEGPRTPGQKEKKRVLFNENFVLYRILTLLGPLQTYEIKYLLEKLIPMLDENKSLSEVLNDLCTFSDVVGSPKRDDASIDILDFPSRPLLDETENDIPLAVETQQKITRGNTRKKGKRKNVQ